MKSIPTSRKANLHVTLFFFLSDFFSQHRILQKITLPLEEGNAISGKILIFKFVKTVREGKKTHLISGLSQRLNMKSW